MVESIRFATSRRAVPGPTVSGWSGTPRAHPYTGVDECDDLAWSPSPEPWPWPRPPSVRARRQRPCSPPRRPRRPRHPSTAGSGTYVVLVDSGADARAVAAALRKDGATVTSVNTDIGLISVRSTSAKFLQHGARPVGRQGAPRTTASSAGRRMPGASPTACSRSTRPPRTGRPGTGRPRRRAPRPTRSTPCCGAWT